MNDKESYIVALEEDPTSGIVEVEISPNASLAQLREELVQIRDVEDVKEIPGDFMILLSKRATPCRRTQEDTKKVLNVVEDGGILLRSVGSRGTAAEEAAEAEPSMLEKGTGAVVRAAETAGSVLEAAQEQLSDEDSGAVKDTVGGLVKLRRKSRQQSRRALAPSTRWVPLSPAPRRSSRSAEASMTAARRRAS